MQVRKSRIREDLLTAADLRRLARSEKKPRTARRMLAIANALDGMTFSTAARVVGMERQALGDAVQRYNAEGVEGLYDRTKPGRPRKLDAGQEAELAQIVLAGPDPETDGISAYTLEDLAGIANERWGVSYHPWSMSRVIKRLGFSRQKARPTHPKTDEAAQAAFKGARRTAARRCRYTSRQAHSIDVPG
jgi:transposase